VSALRGLVRRIRSTERRKNALDYLVFAILGFVPMLMGQSGAVTDDTKTYLYLDPGRYLRQALSLWDPQVALGTVTHENIGYLLPMGPFYWILAELHTPLWIAQRLWLGALLFAAGSGMLYLCRVIGLSGPGRYVAALGFMFTPYVLQYSGRISVILMPWSGLPWLIAFVILALRKGGWRYPALFALVVALVSGINASSILYVGVGPALWLPFAVLVLREATWRQARQVAWRVGLLTALVSLWWVIGLQVEAAYGVNILKYSETLPATSSASSPYEILRGLGYWFFYGNSPQFGNWTQAAVAYTQHLWLILLTFLIPASAFLAAALLKWRQRTYFIILLVVGMVLAVGPYPYYSPTGVSGLIKSFMLNTTAGLALRSTDRASPLVLLALAVLLGAGITAVTRRVPAKGWIIAGFAVAAIAGASAPLWSSGGVVNGLTQPATPPGYVLQAAAHLNHTHPGTRVYALPGNNFAAYRWGDTIDTVWPGILQRPFVTHEQQAMGSLPTADLLEAADAPLQEGVLDPDTIAPLASLMSAGDVLVQYDQQYERYNSPDPQQLATDLTPTPPGLTHPVSYGAPRPNVSTVADLDGQSLARPANQGWTAPLVSYSVTDPRPVTRAESLQSPLVVSGNASGLAAASSVGLLAGNPTIFYTGTLDANAVLRKRVLGGPANLVVTDTNRKQGYRWNGIAYNAGYTETKSDQSQSSDPTNSALNLFPHGSLSAKSTAVFNGVRSVTASSYGSPSLFYPDQRPAAALDGSTATGWITEQFPLRQWWQVQFTQPRTADSINLVQPTTAQSIQAITEVSITFDGTHHVLATLGPKSWTNAGQTFTFSARTFSTLRITIIHSKLKVHHYAAGFQNPAGFMEVRIPGVTADETVSMPQDLLRATGSSSLSDPLSLIMTRQRSSGFSPRNDTELTLSRTFWLPTARTFALTGQSRVSALADDATVATAVGGTGTGPSAVVASSSSRLVGDVTSGALAAVDGNPATAWQSALGGQQAGSWVQYSLARPVAFATLGLQVVSDGRHSVPTAIIVSAGGRSESATLAPIAPSSVAGSVVDVPVRLATPLTGSVVRVTFTRVRVVTTLDYNTQSATALPLGIAEVGIPGVAAPALPAALPATCRTDLVTVDGSPLWVRVSGSVADALARRPLSVSLCGPDASGVALGPGNHTLASASGQLVGLDIDQLALASAAGGAATIVSPSGQLSAPQREPAPVVTVVHQTATAIHLSVASVPARSAPFELVMGQSINSGWQATVNGHSLGTPVLIDGFANGWTVDLSQLGASVHHGVMDVTLTWAPQKRVDVAVIVSTLGILACLVLAMIPAGRWRRRRRNRARSGEPEVVRGATANGESDRATRADVPVSVPNDQDPGLISRHDPSPPLPKLSAALWIAVAVGLIAGAISAPLTGVAVATATFLALRSPRLRPALGFIAVALILSVAAFITIRQGIHPERPDGGWPAAFGTADSLAWAAVVFLGADGVIELMARRSRRLAEEAHRVG
jgi:arabinofuranan 3-O-arabinosyltransferase